MTIGAYIKIFLSSKWLRLFVSDITDQAFVGATYPNLLHLEFQSCEVTVQGVLSFLESGGIIPEDHFEVCISACDKINSDDIGWFSPFVS